MRIRFINTVGDLIPVIVFLITVGGLVVSLLAGNVTWAIKGVYLAFPAVVSCLILYDIKGRNIELPDIYPSISYNPRSSFAIFYILFFSLITCRLLFPNLDIVFNVGMPILFFCILLQILYQSDISPGMVMLETISLISLFFYEIVVSVPLYFGETDILMHSNFDLITYLTHHIVPNIHPFVESGYANFPLYHLLFAEIMTLSNLSSEVVSRMLTWPITAVLVVPIIYLCFREVIKNRQILLLSLLSISVIISGNVYNYMFLIPRAFAFFGFFLMLYIVLKMYNPSVFLKRVELIVLLLPVMLYIVLVHQVSTLLILVLFALLIISEAVVDFKKYFTNIYILFFVSLASIYWFFFASDFIRRGEIIPRFLLGSKELTLRMVETLRPVDTLSYFLINSVESAFIIFLLILAIGYLLRNKKIEYLTVLGVFALLSLLLFIKNPFQSMWIFSRLLATERFVLLLFPFMSLMAGVGLSILYKYCIKKMSKPYLGSVIFFIFFLVFIVSTLGLLHNDMGYPEKIHFESSELIGYSFITREIPFNTTIYSDYYTVSYFNQEYFPGVEELGIPYYYSNVIYNLTSLFGNQDYLVIPMQQFYKTGLITIDQESIIRSRYLPSKEHVEELTTLLQHKNKLYSNSVIETYSSWV